MIYKNPLFITYIHIVNRKIALYNTRLGFLFKYLQNV